MIDSGRFLAGIGQFKAYLEALYDYSTLTLKK
jgi:hypothetical protein